MVLAPVVSLISATWLNGILAPVPEVSIRFPMRSGVLRVSSLKRQMTSYDLLPTKICEMALPPMASSIRSATSETFNPYWAIRSRSAIIWSWGRGGSWSTATSVAPGICLMTLTTLSAIWRVSMISSPYIFSARSLCAPAIWSITMSIIGWEKPTEYPGMVMSVSFIASISLALLRPVVQLS